MEDIFLQIRELEKGLFYDPNELQKLDERLQSIYEIKSKYGKSYDEIIKFAASAQGKTYLSENADNRYWRPGKTERRSLRKKLDN